jgi:D-3-phosphoglycerate dehydrogenase
VRDGGGQVTSDPAVATAVVWLSKDVDALRAVVHDGVRWVQLPDSGVDRWIDAGVVDASRCVTSARGCYGRQVAEHALALVLACARDLSDYARRSSWERPAQVGGRLLAAAEVLVVGAGDIGSCLVDLLRAIGARPVAVTRSGRVVQGAVRSLRADQLREALPSADFVVLSAPSTPDTRSLFGRPEFAAMKRTAYLVNVSRGELVNTEALAQALRDGEIAGAGLDVVDPEPLPSSSPLWTLRGVLITPHVANPAQVKLAALAERVRINTRRFADGDELVGLVDMARGY